MVCCDRPADSDLVQKDDLNPIANRRCRDVFWLLLFFAGACGAGYLAHQGITEGDLDRLRFGISSNSTLCGKDSEAAFPKLVFCFNATATADLAALDLSIDTDFVFQVCASKCPQSGSDLVSVFDDKPGEFVQATGIPQADWEANNHQLVKRLCVAPSVSVLNRCVLDLSVGNATVLDILYDLTISPADALLGDNAQMFLNAYNDIWETWYIIALCGLGGGAIVSFTVLQLLRWFGSPIIWSTILFFVVFVFVINGLIAIKAGYATEEDVPNGAFGSFPSSLLVESEYAKYWKIIFWVVAGGTVVLLFVLAFMINRIRLAIALIKEAAAVMRWVPQLMLTPIIPAVSLTVVVAYSLIVGAFLASTGEIEDGELKWDRELRYSMIYHFGYALWVVVFILGFHSVTMAGTIASYYWTRDKTKMPSSPVSRSIWRAFRYHMGSIAIGSLVLTVVKLIKWGLVYITRKTKKYLGTENKVVRMVLCCFRYIVHCVEKFIQFLTKNAYIMVAVDGRSFCYSAGQAWKLITANVARMTAVNIVSMYLFFLSKIAVGLFTALFTVLWIDNVMVYHASTNDVTSSFAPAVCAFILGYFVAFLFFEVVDFTVDTLLLSFCLDDMRNCSTGNYYASTRLQKFMAVAPKIKQKKEEA